MTPLLMFNDFKGNLKTVSELKEWLKPSHPCGILLIIGPSGSGKTTLYDIIKNEDKCDTLFLTDNNFSETTIQNFAQSKTILSFFDPKKKLIFIDDVDTISTNKQMLTNITEYKKQVTFIITVNTREEKKIVNSWKKLIDAKVYLNKLGYKECFQIALERTQDRDDIDQRKLLELIKAQDCNLANVFMMIETTTDEWDNVDPLASNMDMFQQNIYNTVSDLYTRPLSNEYIDSICTKDSSIVSSLVHENISKLKFNIDDFLKVYDVFVSCDVVDKHIYQNCNWGVNWTMLNLLRFKSCNELIMKNRNASSKTNTIAFTQQFTKLSSQVTMKKKLLTLPQPFVSNTLDVLHYLSSQKLTYPAQDKPIKDLVTKFEKDFPDKVNILG